jgi:phage head maturation protease
MTKTAGPRGWHRGMIERRFVDDGDAGPISFDRKSRTVDAVLSKGSPVQRFYGTETLRISRSAVDLSRVNTNNAPLLDSHNQLGIASALGRITNAWFEGGALVGKLKFNRTAAGDLAMGMVERGELGSLSAGYSVSEWEIRDENGDIVDPDTTSIRWDDNLSFEATRWQLIECSLVLIPADSAAMVRSFGGARILSRQEIANVRARMQARERMCGMAPESVADVRARMLARQRRAGISDK